MSYDERLILLARSVDYPAGRTGAEVRLTSLARELERAGAAVDVVARSGDAPAASSGGAREALRRLPEPLRGARRDVSSFAGGAWWATRTARRLERFRPTAVVERARYLDPSGAVLARRLGVPYVVELHGMLALDATSYYRSPLQSLGSRYERLRYRHADLVVAVSEGLRRFAADTGARRTVVIPNGVDPPGELTARPDATEKLRSALDLHDRRIVGWIGQLMDWQAPSMGDLAEALAIVGRTTPVALVVVGTVGPRAAAALDRAGVTVRMLGSIPRDEVDEIVRGFEVGFVPGGLSYALPVKLFHYAALEVPAVVPMLESISAFAGDRNLFFGYVDGDPSHLADALEAALRSAGDPRVRELHDLVLKEHTWSAVARQLLDAVVRLTQT